MKFSVGKQSLSTELGLLQGVVERKTTIPILTNVLIDATDASQISMVATDLDVSLQTQCVADVSTPGSAVVNAKKLLEIVRSLPDSDVVLEKEDDDWVKITCGSARFKIVGHAKEHFPSVPQVTGDSVSLRADVLHSMVTRTIFAITQEESRYALGGALFMISEGKAQLVTTDGHRLALSSCTMESSGPETRVIIPRKALGELQRLAGSAADQEVLFSKDENHMFFGIGARKLTSRMLAGQFPNYDMVIPKGNDKLLPLSLDRIQQAMRRAVLMADERSHGVKFEVGDGQLTIQSQTADTGESTEVLQIDYNQGEASLRFNAIY
ncbi:MAG: DNA polymerase III subunit beta, partial [Blastocatellia bacterium]